MLVIVLWISVTIAAGALAMTIWNLSLFRRAETDAPASARSVTVCIPARNEEANIEACVRSALASDHPATTVLVYDDQSSDGTGKTLERLRSEDGRVAICPTRPLLPGWVGKQHGCDQLGRHAHADWLLFIDADVRLSPDCIRRAMSVAGRLNAVMLSTFPRQITGTLVESLMVPMIHFILLSYLPFARMRGTNSPAASAACGQFILVQRDAYLAAGGHGSVKDSMHDGVKLPRVMRRAGFHTDLFDGTDVATCRMYVGAGATWRGFAKNAYEGLGSPVLLVFLTLLHVLGHLLPWAVLAVGGAAMAAGVEAPLLRPMHLVLASMCAAMNLVQRGVLAHRFSQSQVAAALHPVGIVMMTLVQWYSFVMHLSGKRSWRGRVASTGGLSGMGAEGAAP